MNPIVRWFHQLGSPPTFDRFAARWSRVFYLAAVPVLLVGMWQALLVVPPEAMQLDSFRILYIHVPSAWMSLFVFALMALYAAIALIWRIKVCEILAMACAPMGAGFTLITLLTGSIWGKGTWGTWWDWDPRMTSELVLLFLYLGVIGLYHAIDDRRSAARAAGLLAIVGVGLLPVIRYSVDWFGGLHQRQAVFLALEHRQAVVMRTDATGKDGVAVEQQMLGRDGGADEAVALGHILGRFACGDVLEDDL